MPARKNSSSSTGLPAILVIESNKFQRRSLCRLMRSAGADHTAEALDPADAGRVLERGRWPQWIVVTDPDLLGEDALATLRRIATGHPVGGVILLSRRRPQALPALREEACKAGLHCLAALRKPVSAEEMGALLRQYAAAPARPAMSSVTVLSKEELSECLRAGRLRAHFQPKVDLLSGRPVSCEALPYVTHARHGVVPVARFRHAMKQLGAQRVMTASVLRDAAELVRSLREKGLEAQVAVNLSADVLSEAGDAASLDSYVRTLGVAPSDLAFEIAASPQALAAPDFADNLARLKLRGYALVIDEEAAPGRLEAPAHAHFCEIKIDVAAAPPMQAEGDGERELASAVAAARRHGMATCAVGVHSSTALDQARGVGFQLGQGELFAPSLPAEEVLSWVEREERTRTFAARASWRHRAG
ncbi:MAG: EAL domain-containing protein [Burkholderiales bacterium]|nr:EAL domain-containing protein [Burkholderiales bacterium]